MSVRIWQAAVVLPIILLINVAGVSCASADEQRDAPGDKIPYADGGANTCLKCHDDPSMSTILNTPHGQMGDPRTPFAAHGCETCHGASPEHYRKSDTGERAPRPKITFGRHSPTPVAEQNKVCLGCHESGKRMNWRGSQHQFADVPCASCHSVHSARDDVLFKPSQPNVCYACHASQRAQALLFSSHPIEEGKVVCSDCHNVHGSFGPKLLVKGTLNDTCYECHQEKRGPFLWEHAPVREDCSNCHLPHGAAQPRLLKVRTPWLCQQCHLAPFHPSTAYSGTGVPPTGAADRLLVQGCLNCHSQVHGSNHPSGVRLMR